MRKNNHDYHLTILNFQVTGAGGLRMKPLFEFMRRNKYFASDTERRNVAVSKQLIKLRNANVELQSSFLSS